jgi:hypothetical protein
MVSQSWKSLTEREREPWIHLAARDRARFEFEKAAYTGRWKAPKNERPPKDPNAPKRPITAFLAFSNRHRTLVKAQNPGMRTTSISKILAQMWKIAPKEERLFYIEQDRQNRKRYKTAMAEYNALKASDRARRESEALQKALLSRQYQSTLQEVVSYKSEEIDRCRHFDDYEDCWDPLPLGSSRADVDDLRLYLEVFPPDDFHPCNIRTKDVGIVYKPSEVVPAMDKMIQYKTDSSSMKDTPTLIDFVCKTDFTHAIGDDRVTNERHAFPPVVQQSKFFQGGYGGLSKPEVVYLPRKETSNPTAAV